MKTTVRDKIVEKILSIIVEECRPDKVILFGSRAKGRGKEESDYDIMIIKDGIKNEREITRPLYRTFYENKIPVAVELIAVDKEKWEREKGNENMIYRSVDKEGVVLYG